MIGAFPIGDLPIGDEPVDSAPTSITGTAAITLGAVTLVSAGNLPIVGTSAVTLGAVTVASTGNLPIVGTSSVTLGAVTLASAGNLPIVGTLAKTLGAVTLASAGNLPIVGSSSITLGAVTLASAGNLPIACTAAITLGDVTLSSASTIGSTTPITGTAAITLGAVTLASAATGPQVTAPGSGFGGWAYPDVHRQGDTRWDGVREAREEARRLFDEVAATSAPKRKEAAVRASEAVANVARTMSRRNPPQIGEGGLATAVVDDRLTGVLGELEQLQAYLQGLLDQQARIKADQAREMADRWALIEREMMAEAAREEELMLIFALAS